MKAATWCEPASAPVCRPAGHRIAWTTNTLRGPDRASFSGVYCIVNQRTLSTNPEHRSRAAPRSRRPACYPAPTGPSRLS